MNPIDLTSDEALIADLARVRQIADLTSTDPLLVAVRETNTYRAALRETRAALDAALETLVTELYDDFGGTE